ncbi:MAG: HDIG domain-containing protein [Candidatus Kryptonium sp.]|nr:HDIG domain-containing protein [Candidatus Kryptonium sp.]MCX7762791.1 HDIG domain-containing protein [Candidatus Kryptonium sp.]MDW8108047.1 HDIG domain-containing protein [Candidatus Kryptonium sp.]
MDLKNLTSLFSKDLLLKVAMFLSIPFLLVILFRSPYAFEYKYEVGSVWLYDDVVAPFAFPIYKDEKQYQEELAKVYSEVYFIFDVDTQVHKTQMNEFRKFLTDLRSYLDLKQNYQIKLNRGVSPNLLKSDSVEIDNLKKLLIQRLSEEDLDKIELMYKIGYFDFAKLKVVGETYLSSVYQPIGVISIPRTDLKRNEIVLRKGKFEEVYKQGRFYDLNECYDLAKSLTQKNFSELAEIDSSYFDLIAQVLYSFVKPNLLFNEKETNSLIEREKSKVLRTAGIVRENEKIISRHEIITPEKYLKLESLKIAQRERGIGTGRILKDLGRFILTASILAVFWIYLYMYRKKIYFDNKLLSLITALFIFEILLAFLITKLKAGHEANYLILIPAFSMLMTIVFDSRVAFWATVVISLMIGSVIGYDYGVISASFVAGTVAIYSVRSIGNRMQIFKSFIFIFIAYAFVLIGFSFQKYESAEVIFTKLGFVAANALLSPILTYGLLIFLERIFGIMTEITLLELSDFNHPLLRELSARAPGTFHHSIAVATLAEAAAKAIGANPVLARVGAYYHDVGKILNPEFFVENQMESEKLHSSITPEQSVKIIISHVEEGQKIAKRYKLPLEIIKFIPMHHGTTLVAYFYGKALKRKELKEVEIEESDFRYKGPKPDSKETGIVMLADSVEAAVRSLDEKTPENIEKTVEAIFESRIEDGQLDESNLTLKDIEEIKKTFIQMLNNLYHPRVKYPGQEKITADESVDKKELKLRPRKRTRKLKNGTS